LELATRLRLASFTRLTCIFESECYDVIALKPLWLDFQRNVTFSAWMDTMSFENREDSVYFFISRIDAYVNHLKHVRRNSGSDMPLVVEKNLQADLFPVVLKECYRSETSGETVSKQKSKTIGIIFAHTFADSTKKYLADMNRFAEKGILRLLSLALMIDQILLETAGVTMYGNKYDVIQDSVIFFPILDEAHLEQRRKDFGLLHFEEYKNGAIEFARNKSFGY